MGDPVRVLVVDDQEVVRNAARTVLEAAFDFQPVGEVASGVEALTAIEELEPDLVLLDVRMPDMDGIETAQRIWATGRDTVVVLMSSDDNVRAHSPDTMAFVAKHRLKAAVLRELWARLAPSG
jgi:DNA-binding NarL/FixJ family response regulator